MKPDQISNVVILTADHKSVLGKNQKQDQM